MNLYLILLAGVPPAAASRRPWPIPTHELRALLEIPCCFFYRRPIHGSVTGEGGESFELSVVSSSDLTRSDCGCKHGRARSLTGLSFSSSTCRECDSAHQSLMWGRWGRVKNWKLCGHLVKVLYVEMYSKGRFQTHFASHRKKKSCLILIFMLPKRIHPALYNRSLQLLAASSTHTHTLLLFSHCTAQHPCPRLVFLMRLIKKRPVFLKFKAECQFLITLNKVI